MEVGQWSEDGICKVVGDNVRRIREGRGISLEGLGAIIHIHPSVLEPLEAGRPIKGFMDIYLEVVVRIANALGVSPLVLFREH